MLKRATGELSGESAIESIPLSAELSNLLEVEEQANRGMAIGEEKQDKSAMDSDSDAEDGASFGTAGVEIDDEAFRRAVEEEERAFSKAQQDGKSDTPLVIAVHAFSLFLLMRGHVCSLNLLHTHYLKP